MNSQCKFRSLDAEEVYGKNKLDVFKKRGTLASVTDFSTSQYAYSSNSPSGFNGRLRTYGAYYTKTLYCEDVAVIVGYHNGWIHGEKALDEYLGLDTYEDFRETGAKSRTCGIRLAMPYDSIDSIPNNGKPPVRADDGVLEVEYGYLPHHRVGCELTNKLDKLDKKGKLIETPYEYTTDGRAYSVDKGTKTKSFLECKNKVYEYKGKFYAKIYNAIDKDDKERYSWQEVLPVKWWIDEESKLMITEEMVYSGIEFKDIDMFLDKYLSKELTQIRERDEIEIRQKYEPSFLNKLLSKRNKVKLLPEGTAKIEQIETNYESKSMYENTREEQTEKTQYLEDRIRQAAKAKEKTQVTKESTQVNPVEEKVNNILDAQMNRDTGEINPPNQYYAKPQVAKTDRTYYVKGEDGELYSTRDSSNSDYYIGSDGVLRPTKEPVENHQEDSAPTNNQYVAKITADKLFKKPIRSGVDLSKPPYEPKEKRINPEEQDDDDIDR